MLLALLLAGVAEGLSLSALLPLLGLAINQEARKQDDGAESVMGGGEDFEQMVLDVFHSIGISPTMGVLLAVIVSGIVAKNILVLLARKQIGYTAAQVTTDLRLALLRAVLTSRWDYFLNQPIGGLTNSMATEAMRASNAYVYGTTMIARFIETVVYMGLALLVAWKATLAALGVGIVVMLSLHSLVRMSRSAGKRQTKLMNFLIANLTDTLQSVKPLKAMGRENLADSVLSIETSKLNKALQKEVFSKAVLNAVQEPLFVFIIALGIYVAFTQWEMPLATLMMLVLLLGRMLNQIGNLQRWYQKMIISESAFWSLQDAVEKAKKAHEVMEGTKTPSFKSAIRFEEVSFSYNEKPVLKDVSFTVPAGKLTTLVGPSGAGKTTIVDLVTGLLKPVSGTVYVDDIPLGELDIKQWRHKIGYVPQENLLLHDSVFKNVTLGDPSLTEEDTEYALRAAGAWEFVSEMPGGIHGTVGERGAKLSGGQRQRIMIARALAHRPEFLILDEATSALDPKSQEEICETLRMLRGELTMLAISHQSAMVHNADIVYQVKGGRVMPKDSDDMPDFSGNESS